MFPGETLECHPNLLLEDKGCETLQLESFWRQELLRDAFTIEIILGCFCRVPVRGRPGPVHRHGSNLETVLASFLQSWQTRKQNKWNRKERRWKPNNLWLYPMRLPAWLGMALQGAGEKKKGFWPKGEVLKNKCELHWPVTRQGSNSHPLSSWVQNEQSPISGKLKNCFTQRSH